MSATSSGPGAPIELVVEQGGSRLDSWLSASLSMPRNEAVRLIEQGNVLVDGVATPKSVKVRVGQRVKIIPASIQGGDDRRVTFKIRHEDDHIAIIAKPEGVVVHPAPGTKSETLVEALARQMPLSQLSGPGRPGIVHRLDKDTSGLLVVAKTDAAYVQLIEAMKERKIERAYIAMVLGRLGSTTGRIEAPVGRSTRDRVRMGVGGTRDAVTEFRVKETLGEQAALVQVKLLTGRTHQIRVHMAHIGHPIVGDANYGRKASSFAKAIGLTRPFLHASKLELAHPINANVVSVEEPLPQDLVSALEKARQLTR